MTKYPLGPRVRVACTKADITKAVANDSTHCWIAEAIKREVPTASHVAVDLSTIRFTNPERDLRYVYLTPYQAQLALLAFDEGTPPEPFTFILKNAHVTRANVRRRPKGSEENPLPAGMTQPPTTAVLAASGTRTTGGLPRRVGGKRPPQLKMMRKFGVRAFRGASQKRLEADAALKHRAEADGTP
jgi:hypothetical protein